MLTPQFSVTQTEDSVLIKIHIPHVRVSGAEIVAEKKEFTFYCKPYILKLALPEEVCEDESCHATYDPNDRNGTIIATLPKKNPGTYFPDLDLSTLLLQSRKEHDDRAYTFPSIEVISESPSTDAVKEHDIDGTVDTTLVIDDIQLHTSSYGFNQKYTHVLSDLRDELVDMIRLRDPDKTPVRERRELRLRTEKIEFDGDRYLGDLLEGSDDMIFQEAMGMQTRWDRQWNAWKEYQREHPNMIMNMTPSCPDNMTTTPLPIAPSDMKVTLSSNSTTLGGIVSECSAEKEGIPADGSYPPALVSSVDIAAATAPAKASSDSTDTASTAPAAACTVSRGLAEVFEMSGGFSEEEQQTMRTLPRRAYLIPRGSVDERRTLLSLVDIIFAYCYDTRITQGEPTVESAHTISVLSQSLSWLEDYAYPSIVSIKDVLIYSARRALIYPYLRMWKLVRKCIVDVSKVFLLGQRSVLQCLLAVHRIFEKTDTHYLLNKVFMDDYCVWVQFLGGGTAGDEYADDVLRAIGKECNAVKSSIDKCDMGDLCIPALERKLESGDEGVQQEEESVPTASSDFASVEDSRLVHGLEGLLVSGGENVLSGGRQQPPLIQVIGEDDSDDSNSECEENSSEEASDSESEYETESSTEDTVEEKDANQIS